MDWDDVAFLDVEADRGGRVLSVGLLLRGRAERIAPTAAGGARLRDVCGAHLVAGHNVIAFDLPHLSRAPFALQVPPERVIDTLVLSMLADPGRLSHALDKGRPEERAGAVPDPVADAHRTRALAELCASTLAELPGGSASVYAALLTRAGQGALSALLDAREAQTPQQALAGLASALLERLCRVHLQGLFAQGVLREPEEFLAAALALRFVEQQSEGGRLGRPPSAMLARMPRFAEFVSRLLGPLCPDQHCVHRHACQVHRPFAEELLQSHFELREFRAHQKDIVLSVLQGKKPLVVLPTGGGKSLCYQLPAIHGAERLRGLTVVVSPLQALMADQVQGLSRRYPPVCSLNASLLMETRRQNLAGLRAGRYNVLYIGPEQLRNPSVRRMLQNRPPFLWVVDEAHCVSQWGHSFRTDYTYLPRAIAELHDTRRMPLLALFTATATAEVRQDIARQFEAGTGAQLTEMDHGAPRDNLRYEVLTVADGQVKRNELLNLLQSHQDGARLVYCATVREACDVEAFLRAEGIRAALYHGRLPPNEKTEQLDRFLSGRAATVVATSAFGMGIDKPDIRLVVHYEPSGSLEDYVQETGRAGRDGEHARCVLLFDEADLETQFFLKTMSRVSAREVRRVWNALRVRARRLRHHASVEGWVDLWVSPEELFVEEQLERELDWSRDVLQTKLKLVLYHLEADGVCIRQENRTRPWGLFPLKPYDEAVAALPTPTSPATRRVLDYLYSPERPRQVSVLDVADETGLLPGEAFREIQALTSRGLIGQELSFDVTLARGVPRSTQELSQQHFGCARTLLDLAEDTDGPCIVQLRSAAAGVERALGRRVTPSEVFFVLRGLRNLQLLRLERQGPKRYLVDFEPDFLAARERLRNLQRVAEAVLVHIDKRVEGKRGRDVACTFDVRAFLDTEQRLSETFNHTEVVDACLLLHHLEVFHLSDPPVLLEAALRVRVRHDAPVSALDRKRPARYYEHQVSLVHMMRNYAVIEPERRAEFMADYFRLPREALFSRYFEGQKRRIVRPVSARTEARLLEGLTAAQREAVTAEDTALLVVAGPGSGKTHTVVRRVCHMVRARQIRPESILVLAFNRAAVIELGARLERELGKRARRVEVRTFHGFALQVTGADLGGQRDETEARLDGLIREAGALLAGGGDDDDVQHHALRQHSVGHIKHVLVDEYQDLDADQYHLLAGLVGLDLGARDRTERSVYVVGDDDQAIYGFRKASVAFLRRFERDFKARRICLTENFRSNVRIVAAANACIAGAGERMKTTAEEQMRAAPHASAGDDDSVRVFRYRDGAQANAHAGYIVQRSLEQRQGNIAVLARNWSDLDSLRGRLESQGVPFSLHHSDYHRPIHRRHPAERVLRALWKTRTAIEGATTDWLRDQLVAMGRSPDEPTAEALLIFAEQLDQERDLGDGRGLCTIDTHELADRLLLASRDAARVGAAAAAVDVRVHLSTFHSAKGLEFDKTIILPTLRAPAGGSEEGLDEERRLFYVALTRAREQLIVGTTGSARGLSEALLVPVTDLRDRVGRLPAVRVACLDCDPSDVQLANRTLGQAQAHISRMREGQPLAVEPGPRGYALLHEGTTVGLLSALGSKRLQRILDRFGRQRARISATVHEVFVHLERRPDGQLRRRTLVVIPAVRVS